MGRGGDLHAAIGGDASDSTGVPAQPPDHWVGPLVPEGLDWLLETIEQALDDWHSHDQIAASALFRNFRAHHVVRDPEALRAAIGRAVEFMRAREAVIANIRLNNDGLCGDRFRAARNAFTGADLALLTAVAEGGGA